LRGGHTRNYSPIEQRGAAATNLAWPFFGGFLQAGVVAEAQRRNPILINPLGPELGQVLAFDQLLSKLLDVLRGGLGRNKNLQLARCQYARNRKPLDELFESDRHSATRCIDKRASIMTAPESNQ
jgi:hypothetical protein